jgi:NAD(P)-dependent dehydrogenase (short-subunit alcohol dehydrogenase family)
MMGSNDGNNENRKRIALVTGANTGLGFEIARQLSQKGIHVLIGSRDEERGKKAVEQLTAEQLSVSMIQIDVTDQTMIDMAVQTVTSNYGRLDILVNNSGVFEREVCPSELTLEKIRHNFEVNFFGAFSVTKAFLPLLRQSLSARIVNVSSGLGTFGLNQKMTQSYNHCAYSASKAALNMFTFHLAKDLENTNIKVNACTPGLTATALTNYEGHSVDIGASSTILLATLPDDGPTGKFYGEDCQENPW